MLNIAIDLGSYSIKFIHFKIDKKRIATKSTHEIILELPEDDKLIEHELWNSQVNHIKTYLDNIKEDFQLIMNMNSEIISTRFLNVPGKNKKRAQMMVPFLIEEDLPFPITACHYSEAIEVKENSCDVLAGVIKKDHFNDFYSLLAEYQVEPKILTNDVSIFSSYIKSNHMNFSESFCILEFGHEATRGYFFHKGQLVANHHSFVAGKVITEGISKTYNISQEEATIYKHQNAFVLTDGQFDEVNDNQKEFAKLMESTLQPLISEVRRWGIGFRVKHGVTISDYHICGGTTNINNYSNFISSKLNAKVVTFNPFNTCNDDQIDKDQKFRNKFAQVCTLMQGMKKKSQLINFLRGEFSFQGNDNLPLESLAFVGTRAMILTFIIMIYLLVDSFSVKSQSKMATKEIEKTLKRSPIFNVSARDKKSRTIEAAPENILRKLNKQDKMIQQEIKSIQAAISTNALNSLSEVAELISTSGVDIEIIKFHSQSGDDFDLIIQAKTVESLSKLKNAFTESSKYDFDAEINEQAMTLTINGKEKG
jgi:Tfp pilus assembly PilM family ATPase